MKTQDILTHALPLETQIDNNQSALFENLVGNELFTTEQLALLLNVAPKTIRKWRFEGVFPEGCAIKLRHQVRYKWRNVLRWLETRGG